MNPPLVSVLIPTFNGANFLPDSIASVLAQTHRPLELIVVDDGSTDGTREWLAGLDVPIPLKTLHRQNGGQSAARNLGATVAQGKYLALLDHDDVWYPKHVENLIAPMEKDDRVGWTYSEVDEMDRDGALVSLRVLGGFSPTADHPKTNILNMLQDDMFIFPSAAVVRREAFESIGGFDERLAGYEDDDFFLRLFRQGWLNVFLPESQVKYRRFAGSSTFSERMWRSRDIYAEKLIENFPDDPHLVRFYVRDLIAPRFYKAAKSEYIRHFPHRRFDQCRKAYELMRRFASMMTPLRGKAKLRRELALRLMADPERLARLYPLVGRLASLPRPH